MYILIVDPDGVIVAQGSAVSATLNTPNNNTVWISDSIEEIKNKIIEECYTGGFDV